MKVINGDDAGVLPVYATVYEALAAGSGGTKAAVATTGGDVDTSVAEQIISGRGIEEISKAMKIRPWQLVQFMERSPEVTEFFALVRRTKAAILIDQAFVIGDMLTIPPDVKKDAISMRKWMAQVLDPKTFSPVLEKNSTPPAFNLNITIGGKKTALTGSNEIIDVQPTNEEK